ncbi:MAG: hypothetical protein ACYDDI_03840 [Candidatus Acidiferrales bacterium]
MHFVALDIRRRDLGKLSFASKELFQVFQHLFIPQPGTFVDLRVLHVAFAEFAESDFYGPSENAPQNLRLSDVQKRFGITPVGAPRRFLDSFAVLVEIINPPNTTSFVDTHLRLSFLPFASRTGIVARICATA